MNDYPIVTDENGVPRAPVPPSLVTVTRVVYALHALSILIGVFTGASIATAFVFGWPSIIAVIINYVERSDVRGTYLDSHFSWADPHLLVRPAVDRRCLDPRACACRISYRLCYLDCGFCRTRNLGVLPHCLRLDEIVRRPSDAHVILN